MTVVVPVWALWALFVILVVALCAVLVLGAIVAIDTLRGIFEGRSRWP